MGAIGVRDLGRVSRAATAGPTSRSSVEPICDDADGKKRNGYYWTASRFRAALLDAEAVGLEAARRTLAKLGSRKIATGEVPVIFSPGRRARRARTAGRGRSPAARSGARGATSPSARGRRSRRRWSRSSTIR